MSRTRYFYADSGPYRIISETSKYGFWKFMLDLLMIFLTAGLWIIWIIIREIKNN